MEVRAGEAASTAPYPGNMCITAAWASRTGRRSSLRLASGRASRACLVSSRPRCSRRWRHIQARAAA
eukprot:2741073-Prymnesium_polylepis.1